MRDPQIFYPVGIWSFRGPIPRPVWLETCFDIKNFKNGDGGVFLGKKIMHRYFFIKQILVLGHDSNDEYVQ